MSVEQAGENVRGFAWLVSVAFGVFVGYVLAHRQRAVEVRALEHRLEVVKAAATELLAERQRGQRPQTALDHLLARHERVLAPAILQARETARAAEAWLRDQQRGEPA